MLFFSVSPPPSRSVPLLKQFQNMYVHCLIYLIIIFNVGSDLEVERWRKTNEKKERGREGGCVWERDSKFRGKLVTAQGNKVNAKNNPGAHFPVNVWSRSTHTQTQHTHSHTQNIVPALCCRIQTHRVNCQKTWHDLSDSLSIKRERDWRAFHLTAPHASSAHPATPRALDSPQIITLHPVHSLQGMAKKTWLYTWPIHVCMYYRQTTYSPYIYNRFS